MNLRNLAIWGFIIVFVAVIYSVMQGQTHSGAAPTELPHSALLAKVDDGDITKVVISLPNIEAWDRQGKEYHVVGPPETDPVLDTHMAAKGNAVTVSYQKGNQSVFLAILLQAALPALFLIGIYIFFMRQMQGGARGAMGFGKSKARLLTENKNRVTFEDVAGVDEAKEDLTEIVDFLKDPAKFQRLGGKIPKGALMVGPPGTGKTLLGRAVAGEAGVPFFYISGSDFVEMFVGVGASRVRDMFEQAKKNAPCIIFIDEIDAVGRHRGAGLGGGNDEREQTLNQLLVEMDGFDPNEGIIVIASTNRPDVLDPALLRPGRFDRQVVVPNPDIVGRERILRVHMRNVPLAADVDVKVIARGTPGFSGADLENLVNEAALIAARKNKERLDNGDFEFAKDKVMMGAERRSMIISEKDKKITAWHEAGHALVARLTEHNDPVHKVTIIPRGPALGLTQMLPKEDRLNWNRSSVLDRIAMSMGGRIAEELEFNEITSGAKSDIEHATKFARSMVCEWGMSDKLGPLAFGEEEGEVFLGREFGQRSRNFSEATAIEIDAEVRKIVTEQFSRAKQLLIENKPALDRIARALLEFETLDGEEVEQLIRGDTLNRSKPPPVPQKPAEVRRPEVKEKSKILDALGGLTTPVPKPEAGKA